MAEARKHYDAARASSPRAVGPTVGLARVQIAVVGVPLDYAAAKGNREIMAAEKELARAVKEAPSFGPAFIELGRARLLLGDALPAIDALKRGVELLPDEPEARSQLGIALLATGHAEDAVRELARAAELDPGSAARHGNLGTALMMAGRTKEAIDEYRARARVDDGDARAHSDLGTALLGSQDLQGALTELERAVQIDPRRPAFRLEPRVCPPAIGSRRPGDSRVSRSLAPRSDVRERVDQSGDGAGARSEDARRSARGARARTSPFSRRPARESEPRRARRAREGRAISGAYRPVNRGLSLLDLSECNLLGFGSGAGERWRDCDGGGTGQVVQR